MMADTTAGIAVLFNPELSVSTLIYSFWIAYGGEGASLIQSFPVKKERREFILSQTEVYYPKKTLALGILICFLGAVFYCYEYLLRIQPSVMVEYLMRQFHLTGETFGLLGGLYYAAYSPMQIAVGVLTDMYGPRRMLTFAVIVCTIGSFIFGHTESIYIAGLGRFLIGFGSAFAFVGVLKLAAIWLPESWFAVSAGLATALGMVGALVGDVELSVLVHRIGWQNTVLYSTYFGVALIPLIWFVIRDTHPHMKEDQERVKLRMAMRGVGSIAKNPQMWLAGLIGCALFLSLSVFAEQYGILFLQQVHNFTSKQASWANSMVFMGWLFGAPFFGLFSDLVQSRKWPVGLGAIVAACILFYVIYMPVSNAVEQRYLVYTLLFFFGFFSSAEIICFAIGRENCPYHMAGAAVSFINMLVMFGGAVFQPLFGKLLDMGWTGQMAGGVRVFGSDVYRHALLIIPMAMLFAAFGSFFIRDRFKEVPEG